MTENSPILFFSIKARFSSRSFVRDVIHGKKKLTASSLSKFLQALKFKGVLRDGFICWVCLEDSKVEFPFLPSREILEKILDAVRTHIKLELSKSSDETKDENESKLMNQTYYKKDVILWLSDEQFSAISDRLSYLVRYFSNTNGYNNSKPFHLDINLFCTLPDFRP